MRAFLFVLLSLFFTQIIFAQTSEVADPEFIGKPYYITASNELQMLEKTDADLGMKLKGMGYGGYELYYTVNPDKSTVRFSSGNLPRIIIKVEEGVDPSDLYTVVGGTIKKKQRYFVTTSKKMGGGTRTLDDKEVAIEFKKLKTGVYELIFPKGVPVGEYVFLPRTDENSLMSSYGQKVRVHCFAVD
jgi:hypothetical protein